MKSPLSMLVLALFALTSAAADPLYRCLKDGATMFTDKPPAGASCQPLDLKVYEPDPAEVARLQEKKREDAERERAEQEQAQEDQLRRAQLEAAQAAAREADAQRRLAEQQAREGQQPAQESYWPGYFYGPVFPRHRPRPPGVHPLPRPPMNPPLSPGFNPPALPGFNPPRPMPPAGTPNYPYAPSGGSVGGRR